MHHRIVYLIFAIVITTGEFAIAQDVAEPSAPTIDKIVIPDSDDELPGVGPMRRQDWFREVWRNRRTHFAENFDKDKNAVVFFGDSITQGWGDDFRGKFPGLHCANRGISGDTTRGMLWRVEEDVNSLDPKAIVLLMGTNDLEEHAEPETISENTMAIIEKLKQHNSKAPIVLCQVFPSSDSKKRPSDKIKRLNELNAAAVRGDSQITVLDTWTLFANEKGDAKESEFPDLLHPNQLGYDKWASALHTIFATLELVDRTAEPFEIEANATALFNGKDLTGWQFRPTPQSMRKGRARWVANSKGSVRWPLVEDTVSFDGKVASTDGRYRAINGRLVVTTPVNGRTVQQLWTADDYGDDFELRLEFRAAPNADSGIFIRGKQLQCRDYVLAGPYKELENYKPQDWNEIVIKVQGTTAQCTCNGELLEDAFQVPASGPIGLEGDVGQIEYRRIRLIADPNAN